MQMFNTWIMDALLELVALEINGLHFPILKIDLKWYELLGYVKGVNKYGGYNISNIDAVLIGEEPKIAPYVKEIKANIADVLQIDQTRINIKGLTEKMILR